MNETPTVLLGPSPSGARCVVVLLHGRDQDPDWIVKHVVARLPDDPSVAWIVPAAPGRSWYPGRYTEPPEALAPHLEQALATVDGCVARAAGGVGLARTVLTGFSQGACLAAEYALRHPARYGGLVLFTGAHIAPDTPRTVPGHLDGTPAFLGTGAHDEWVAAEHVRATAGLLADHGARVDSRVYQGRPHEVGDDEIAAAHALLTGVAAPGATPDDR